MYMCIVCGFGDVASANQIGMHDVDRPVMHALSPAAPHPITFLTSTRTTVTGLLGLWYWTCSTQHIHPSPHYSTSLVAMQMDMYRNGLASASAHSRRKSYHLSYHHSPALYAPSRGRRRTVLSANYGPRRCHLPQLHSAGPLVHPAQRPRSLRLLRSLESQYMGGSSTGTRRRSSILSARHPQQGRTALRNRRHCLQLRRNRPHTRHITPHSWTNVAETSAGDGHETDGVGEADEKEF